MGREIRRVPAGWNHPTEMDPKTHRVNYVPLYNRSFAEAAREWDEGQAKWDEGFVTSYFGDEGWKPKSSIRYGNPDGTYAEYAGERPDPSRYMPEWPEDQKTHYMMYETCSEGTPISPSFATPEELARWLADNGASAFADMTASYEDWLRVTKGGYAPSMVVTNGVAQSGVAGL